jgi:hypothetical protein
MVISVTLRHHVLKEFSASGIESKLRSFTMATYAGYSVV